MRNGPCAVEAITGQAGGKPPGRTAHSANVTWSACPAMPTDSTTARTATPSCRAPNACRSSPLPNVESPYARSALSATAAAAIHIGALLSATGSCPATDAHARSVPETATISARHARPRCGSPAPAKHTMAAIGRNAATAQVPGPVPGASRSRDHGSVVPISEVSADAGSPDAAITTGNASTAAASAASATSAEPRSRRRPATRFTRANSATGRTIAGANAAPIDNATPRPTPKRNGCSGARRANAASIRSHASGRTASTTSSESRPSEKDQSIVAESTYAAAATTAEAGEPVWRAIARYIAIPARAGIAPSRTFWASAVLPNATHDPAPRPARAGLPGWTPPRTVVRTPEPNSRKKSPEVGRERGERPAREHLGPDELPHREGPEPDRQDRPEQHRMARRHRGRAPRQRAPELLVVELLQTLVQELLRALEPPREPERGRHERPDLAIGHRADGLGPDPPAERPRQVQEVPPPGGQEVEGVLEPPRQDQEEHPGHAEHHVDGQEPQQREDAVVLEHRGQRGALGVVAGAPGGLLLGPLAASGRVPVAGGRERRHEHPEAGQARPPAEVQVVVVAGEALVERPRPLPRLARDEHDGGGHEQDLEHPVVLPLVQLAVLQGGVGVAEPVGRAPHLPEHPRLVPVDDLGADDAHAFDALDALGGLEEAFDGIGRERRVVVHQ